MKRYEKLFDKIIIAKECMDQGTSMKIMYNKNGEYSIREVMPVSFEDGHNVLTFCGLRKNYRKFSMENILWIDTNIEERNALIKAITQ